MKISLPTESSFSNSLNSSYLKTRLTQQHHPLDSAQPSGPFPFQFWSFSYFRPSRFCVLRSHVKLGKRGGTHIWLIPALSGNDPGPREHD